MTSIAHNITMTPSPVIYPEISIEETPEQIVIRTAIRKQYRKKWYLWYIEQRWYKADNFDYEILNMIKDFHIGAYNSIILGKIDPKAVYSNGEPVFPLDKNQQDEAERLKLIYINLF